MADVRAALHRQLGSRATVVPDLRAGVVLGVESVPDGLASGLLAGVNPVYGLYAYLVGTVAGAAATSSAYMAVQATSAMAVIISDVPATQAGPDAGRALATLALLTGVVMLGLGLFRLGWLVRFVPNSVLTGFINAVAVNIVLGQLDNLTGYDNQGANRVIRSLDTLLHITSFSWASVAVGLGTVVIILVLERTPVGPLGLVVAVVVTSAVAALLHLDSVQTISDIADVPRALPTPALPDLAMTGTLLIPALSLAFVGLVQGAGISHSVPNPDGEYPDASGDFRGQGVANIAAGFFQAMPVGGSTSATALIRVAGARTRVANLAAGVVMALSILLFGDVIGYVAMPALAGLLILIGVRTFKPNEVMMVWRTGSTQAAVMTVTFVLTLIIPLQYAVLVGVGLSVILHVARQSNKITVKRWRFTPGAVLPDEEDPPAVLDPGKVIVLMPYGSLFFAAAPVFEAQLPAVTPDSRGSVVIVRLRGKDELGSTFIKALGRYAAALAAVDSRLVLVGVGPRVYDQLAATRTLDHLGPDAVYRARRRLGDSLAAALTDAQAWTADHQPGPPHPDEEA
ncbi:MAG: SulP family inorganic anion transporter [Actinomycetes bacterium]